MTKLFEVPHTRLESNVICCTVEIEAETAQEAWDRVSNNELTEEEGDTTHYGKEISEGIVFGNMEPVEDVKVLCRDCRQPEDNCICVKKEWRVIAARDGEIFHEIIIAEDEDEAKGKACDLIAETMSGMAHAARLPWDDVCADMDGAEITPA